MEAMGYRATRLSPTELVVHDVPIFCECSRGDAVFDKAWIASAVKAAKQSEAEGYFPPLHIRHHEPATEQSNAVKASGYFRITDTRQIQLKGKSRQAVFADLHVTDATTIDEVLSKRLPYRSVEIFNVDTPGLNSLALLDHEAPFLELPMLMVSQVDDAIGAMVQAGNFRVHRETPGGPVSAFVRSGVAAGVLFKGDNMTQKRLFAAEPDEEKSESMADDSEKETKGENMDDGGGSIDAKAIIKAIENGTIELGDFEAIEAALAARKGGGEAADEPEDELVPSAAPGGEAFKQGGDRVTPREAKLMARLEAAELRLDARDQSDQRRTDISDAMLVLRDKPIPNKEARLSSFHEKHGREAFKSYVEGLAETVGDLPSDQSGERFSASASSTDAPSDAVMKVQSDNPEHFELACAASAEWKQVSQFSGISEDAYIKQVILRKQGKSVFDGRMN